MARQDIFNKRRHRLLRKQVSLGENAASLIIAIALVGVAVWVAAQRDAYDPAMRDLAPELLSRDGPKIQLYNQPLKPWVEPGQSIAVAATPNIAPFPPTLLNDGWSLAGRVRSFDASNLYEKINGEAEKFIKQGFEALHYAVIKAPDGTELSIELYDQGNLGGSLGIFSQHKPAQRAVEEKAGTSYFLTTVGVIGRKGQYFFRAAADRGGELVRDKSLALVDALATLVGGPKAMAAVKPAPAPQTPAEVMLLREALGIAETALTFESANVFQFDFAKDFWFAALDGKARAFLHTAASEDEARILFQALLEEQSYDYEVLQQSPARAILKHNFLATIHSLEQRGRYLFGVDNAPDSGSARTAHGKLRQALADE